MKFRIQMLQLEDPCTDRSLPVISVPVSFLACCSCSFPNPTASGSDRDPSTAKGIALQTNSCTITTMALSWSPRNHEVHALETCLRTRIQTHGMCLLPATQQACITPQEPVYRVAGWTNGQQAPKQDHSAETQTS